MSSQRKESCVMRKMREQKLRRDIPFITLAIHYCVDIPIEKVPFAFKAANPMRAKVVSSTAFIFLL